MAYAVTADLLQQISQAELIQLTDDTLLGQIDESRVARAIADAGAEIDGYLAKVFSVPVSPVPDLVRNLTVAIAIYNLYSRRSEVPDNRLERYRAAVRTLENISRGLLTLGTVPAPPENTGEAGTFEGAERVFKRSTLEDF